MNEWLSNLSIGDRVIESGTTSRDSVSVVERLTKTLIITKSGGRYKRINGCAPGEWSTRYLEEPTTEAVNRLRQVNLAIRMKHIDWRLVPLETLIAVYNLLPKKT